MNMEGSPYRQLPSGSSNGAGRRSVSSSVKAHSQ
jgi:hypothetical protein